MSGEGLADGVIRLPTRPGFDLEEAAGVDAAATVEAALRTVLGADSPAADELDRDVYAAPIPFPI